MKLKNKKTGEINIVKVDEDYFKIYKDDGEFVCPVTLKELNDGWQEYEDEDLTKIIEWLDRTLEYEVLPLSVNGFVEKLKAWKRLKDKGFVFKGINMDDGSIKTGLSKGVSLDDCEEFYDDMDLLFGGK